MVCLVNIDGQHMIEANIYGMSIVNVDGKHNR